MINKWQYRIKIIKLIPKCEATFVFTFNFFIGKVNLPLEFF